jgi:L-amino acid N-acyltransferase YncA
MDESIRSMAESDGDRVLAIYAEGIEDGQAAFEDNAASLALQRPCAFRVVGRRLTPKRRWP